VSGSDYERRMIRNIAGIVVILLVMGTGVMLIRASKKPTSVLGVRQTSTPTPTIPPFVFPTPTIPAPRRTPTASPAAPAPTRSASPLPASCHNSTNPACGRFYWSPAITSNAPTEISVRYDPEGTAGQATSIVVTLSDGDAQPSGLFGSWGDGSGDQPPTCPTLHRYGPWTPPAKHGGSTTVTLSHTYAKSGTYTISLIGFSGACGNPYGGRVSTSITVQIDPAAPSPTPTASAT
jgi:hypothetical protein